MMPLKEAVQKSKTYLSEVFPISFVQDFQLEGVELSDDERYWEVTFSYWSRESSQADKVDFSNPLYKTYKTVKLRASDGLLFGVKNANL